MVVGEYRAAEVLPCADGAQVPSHGRQCEVVIGRVSPLVELLGEFLPVRCLPRDVPAVLRPSVREELAIPVSPCRRSAIGGPAELGFNACDRRQHRPGERARR